MTLEENLKLERYKMVTDRQKYFTDLARDSFASYIKVFTYLFAGAITLVSTRSSLQIDAKLLIQLIKGITVLATFLGVVAAGQISFCLIRWYGFRKTEAEINTECPDAEWWAWLFEGLYIFFIAISILVAWFGSSKLGLIIQDLKPN
jgi:hypothetical protein